MGFELSWFEVEEQRRKSSQTGYHNTREEITRKNAVSSKQPNPDAADKTIGGNGQLQQKRRKKRLVKMLQNRSWRRKRESKSK